MRLIYQTERLTIQLLNEDSASLVLEFYQRNKEIFEPWEPLCPKEFYTLAYQEAALKAEFQLFLRANSIRYYIFERTNDHRIVGTLSFYHILYSPYNSCKLGYRLDKDNHGKGYAFEAISYLLPLLFKEQKLHRIEAEIMENNVPSLKLINRLGFTFEGFTREGCEIFGTPTDFLRYSLLSHD